MQPTLVFLPGEFHGQRSLAGYSTRGHKRVGHNLVTKPPPPPLANYVSSLERCLFRSSPIFQLAVYFFVFSWLYPVCLFLLFYFQAQSPFDHYFLFYCGYLHF